MEFESTLRTITDHLKNGVEIKVRDDKVCLIRADGETIARGGNLKAMLIAAIFVLC